MAVYGVSITKDMRWHGALEKYDNTYYYNAPDGAPSPAVLEQIVTRIVGSEIPIHSTRVAFRTARIWSAGGTPLQNETLLLQDLTDRGNQIGAPIFGEAAVLVKWETARVNIKGKKVYLRKFVRPGCLVGTMSAEVGRGEEIATSAMLAPFKTYADSVQTITPATGVVWNLASLGNRQPKAPNNGTVDGRVRSREFRRN